MSQRAGAFPTLHCLSSASCCRKCPSVSTMHSQNPLLAPLPPHLSPARFSSAVTIWIYLHSTLQAAVRERSRLQDGAGWSPVQHPPAGVHPSNPQCWPQAPLRELQQSLLQGKSCREPGRWHRVGRDPSRRGARRALPQHRMSMVSRCDCRRVLWAQWDITVTLLHNDAEGIWSRNGNSELPEAQPCSLDKLDLRARSPPSTHSPSKSTFIS